MIIKIKIDSSGLKNKLNRLVHRAETIPYDKCATVVLNSVMDNFDAGGRYSKKGTPKGGSRKWAKRKDALSHPILKKSGRLQASHYTEIHADGFSIGNSIVYQAVHNFGYPKRNIPARPFLVYQKEDMEKVKKIIKDHVLK